MAIVTASARPLPKALALSLRSFLVVLGVLTLACAGIETFCKIHANLGTPYNWPLMPRTDPFRDFYLYQPRYRFFHTSSFFHFPGPDYVYPAPVATLYCFFYLFPHPTKVFLGALCATFLVAIISFAKALLQRNLSTAGVLQLILGTLLCSYPFAFEFEQANMEWIIWLVVVIGLWAFLHHHNYSAAVCVGIVGALKLYPVIYVALFIPRRLYRHCALAFAVAAIVTLAGLWLVNPDIRASWTATQQGIARFNLVYIVEYREIRFDHSLFALVKFLGTFRGRPIAINNLQWGLARYLPVAGLAGFVIWLLRIRLLPLINQVLCLTIATILLPPVSYDYTLLHLYIPWALLVLFTLDSQERLTRGLTATFCCFAILLAPETEFIWHGQSFGGQIKAVTLLVLFTLALLYPFPSLFDNPLAEAEA